MKFRFDLKFKIKNLKLFRFGISLLIFAAISMFTNDNPMEKDKAKSKIMYIVVGLIVIWIAPIAVNYLTV